MQVAQPAMMSMEEIVAASTKAAEAFVDQYYKAYDSPPDHRTPLLQPLYSPAARITWNGNPIPFTDLPTFLQRMPKSAHEVQAFDCHPISRSASDGAPPSLVVSVTGQVAHGDYKPNTTAAVHSKDFDFLPRVFSQSFILAPNQANQYTISADTFRFC